MSITWLSHATYISVEVCRLHNVSRNISIKNWDTCTCVGKDVMHTVNVNIQMKKAYLCGYPNGNMYTSSRPSNKQWILKCTKIHVLLIWKYMKSAWRKYIHVLFKWMKLKLKKKIHHQCILPDGVIRQLDLTCVDRERVSAVSYIVCTCFIHLLLACTGVLSGYICWAHRSEWPLYPQWESGSF